MSKPGVRLREYERRNVPFRGRPLKFSQMPALVTFVSSDGSSYSGTFTLTQYDTNGNVLVQILGVISAQRVTAD